MTEKTLTERIIHHYDIVSPLYKNLWGSHIHHGYYESGKETKEQATENLLRFLIDKSDIKPNSKVLDVGCGIGGTSIYLAKNLNCDVTGITISPVQVNMAKKASAKLKNKPKFFVANADNLEFIDKFDAVFAIECVSHFTKKKEFFNNISKMLNKNGCICIADWFMDKNLDKNQVNKYIKPIEKGMLVSLETREYYFMRLKSNNLKIIYCKDISNKVKKTWDLALGIVKNKALWELAIKNGKDIFNFLKAFKAMKNGFSSGAFRYKVIIARK